MRMCAFYLDCHEAWLCRYIVIYIENLLRPLHLFYLYLWHIYWLLRIYHTRVINNFSLWEICCLHETLVSMSNSIGGIHILVNFLFIIFKMPTSQLWGRGWRFSTN
jgi:hypothetical protein